MAAASGVGGQTVEQVVGRGPTESRVIDASGLLAHFLLTSARQRNGAAEGPAATPRARLVADLTDAIAAAVAVGDVHAARVAHDALGKLLVGLPADVDAGADLAAERGKRGA